MTFETWLRSDLTKPLKVETLHGVFFTADDAANVIGVEVYDDGATAALSGSCVGYVIRADGGTLIITGAISGNRASITLPASAYVVEGPIDIVIKVVNGDTKTTVGACRGYVVRSTTDAIIDPGHVIPSIEELLAQIEACEQATAAANEAAANADMGATGADTAAAGANAAAANADTAKDRANAAASALENMDATASGLATGAAPTATVSTINDHYRIAFGIPKGDKGDTGDTGAAATITGTATAYQNSTSGTTIPTGAWLDNQPDTPQGQFLWIRTVLTWNNGQTTTMYSVSRMGIDGSGSVVSVNNISPDANGNVQLPIDTAPTQGSQNPVTSGGAYAALAGKQDTLTFDSTPTSGSTNPVTSGGVYSAIDILHIKNAGFHNSIFRGKNLGASVTSAQWNVISSGTFDDLFIGDYWTINGIVWRIAAFDYWYNCGDTACTTHHVVIVPDANLVAADGSTTHWMNATNTTEGAYVGSDFYTGNNGNTGKAKCTTKINSAFGAGHILTHREYLQNAVKDGYGSAGAWYDSTLECMNEQMVYGGRVFGDIMHGSNIPAAYTIGKSQLPLFALAHSFICNRAHWWLRDVVSATHFASVDTYGNCTCIGAANAWVGLRPAFGIRA